MTTPIKLSKRQKQLLAMLERGLSNKDIAEAMQLSEQTVKVHFYRLFNRIGVRSRLEASTWWRKNQPANMQFVLRAAFDAACRLVDQMGREGSTADTAEFSYFRSVITQMEGGAA